MNLSRAAFKPFRLEDLITFDVMYQLKAAILKKNSLSNEKCIVVAFQIVIQIMYNISCFDVQYFSNPTIFYPFMNLNICHVLSNVKNCLNLLSSVGNSVALKFNFSYLSIPPVNLGNI